MTAMKRLWTEYRQITLHGPDGLMAAPKDEDNLLAWECCIVYAHYKEH
jgi:ubiquitin-conjugating enzyme E2 G2